MLAAVEKIQNSFSSTVFLIGLGGVLAVYVALFIYAFAVGGSMLEKLENSLAVETVMIENPHGYVGVAEVTHEESAHQETHAPKEAHHGDKKGHLVATPDHHMPQAIVKGPAAEPQHHNEEQSLSLLLHGDGDAPKSNTHALRKAPIDKITEETPQGLVPVKKPNLPTAFEAYRKPFILNKSRHAVAIVIADYGLSEALSAEILAHMPSPVSLILSPYAAHADSWQKKARSDGHELWMQLPVQTADFPRRDPGIKGLLTEASLAYNEERMEWVLSRTSGYAGLASYTDYVLSKSSPMFTGFFNQVFDRGLGLLELNMGDNGFVAGVARDKKAPYAAAHLSLKSFALDSPEVKAAEAAIKEKQNTVIVVQPTAQNLVQLKNWLMRLENSGVVIAPVSAFAALAVE